MPRSSHAVSGVASSWWACLSLHWIHLWSTRWTWSESVPGHHLKSKNVSCTTNHHECQQEQAGLDITAKLGLEMSPNLHRKSRHTTNTDQMNSKGTGMCEISKWWHGALQSKAKPPVICRLTRTKRHERAPAGINRRSRPVRTGDTQKVNRCLQLG